MKIAIDLLPIREDGSTGGAAGFALELVKGFAAVPDVQVLVLCADRNIGFLKGYLPNNVRFYQMVGGHKFLGIAGIDGRINRIVNKLQRGLVLTRKQIDVLYCPFSAAPYKEKNIPAVSTILDVQHEYYPQFFAPQELDHRRKFYKQIVERVERVVCISDYTKETFCEKYGFPKERAQTIYIAIQNRFSVSDDRILDKLNIREQKYIVYPANFWEHKNHKLLLHAFAMYARKQRDLKLVLTGNPLEKAAEYDQLLTAMDIADRAVITGYVSDEELYSILKNAKGLIYPSFFEGFGIPVVEAMHLHKLIACSNLSSLPEIGCEAIFYFDPKKPDDILKGIQFLADNEITDHMIGGYEEKLKEYAAEKMVHEYLEVFKDTIGQAKNFTFQDEISGIYQDRWSGPEIKIQIQGREGSTIKGILVWPEFVPFKTKIVLEHSGKTRQLIMKPGDQMLLDEKVTQPDTVVSIRMVKTWLPKNISRNNDARRLGVKVESLVLETQEAEVIDFKR